jgi:hypothetical protein
VTTVGAAELEVFVGDGATGELCAETGLAALNEHALNNSTLAEASIETNNPLRFISNLSPFTFLLTLTPEVR